MMVVYDGDYDVDGNDNNDYDGDDDGKPCKLS